MQQVCLRDQKKKAQLSRMEGSWLGRLDKTAPGVPLSDLNSNNEEQAVGVQSVRCAAMAWEGSDEG